MQALVWTLIGISALKSLGLGQDLELASLNSQHCGISRLSSHAKFLFLSLLLAELCPPTTMCTRSLRQSKTKTVKRAVEKKNDEIIHTKYASISCLFHSNFSPSRDH
ncbi:hypothetical protein CPB83DRAFT_841620 [Crepidotus variabilis]|uniref:Uncharacterized protein n=1 Tax=Crepidotus variabilis TaxID=179855 RepID=A0A9P6EU45_9AGAR|nr:hypothetical protein CPB83DRAFT_841620 [Crepidotus variabilis]